MTLRSRSLCLLLMALAVTASTLVAQATPATAVLPSSFAGWEQSGKTQSGTDPRKLDATSAPVLSEDRFTDFEVATYQHEDRTLTVRAARFADAEGAYAAFTYFRQPRMKAEDIGTLAASLNERVLFFVGNILVDAQFDRLTGMSGSQLRELATRLPQAKGSIAELPTLPSYLHGKRLDAAAVPGSARFLLGPAAYNSLNLDLPSSIIDFGKSPKVLWSRLNGEAEGSAEILLVAYPTHIIAMQQLAALQQAPAPPNGISISKRTGPILALVRGAISQGDATRILDSVNYDAEVTWNENTGQARRDNIGNLVVAGLTLAAILFLISVGAGAVFGFGRFFLPRFWGKKRGKDVDDGEMIRLDLR